MEAPGIIFSIVLALIAFGFLGLLSLIIAAGTNNRRLLRLMTGYSLVLSIAIVASLGSSLKTGSLGLPNLLGDGISYYNQAVLLAESGVWNYSDVIRANYLGYQVFLGVLFSIFGESLFVGLLANALILLICIGVLYRAVHLTTESSQAAFYSCFAFALTPQFIYYAILLLKDPAIILAFALVLLGLLRLGHRKSLGGTEVLTLSVAFVILGAMRGAYLFILVAETCLFILLFARKKSYLVVAVMGLLIALLPFVTSMTTRTLDSGYMAATVVDNTVIERKLSGGNVDATGVVGRVSSVYSALPFVLKVPLFFVPAAIQFLLPFEFWSTSFIADHSALFFSRNLNPLWFLFVGIWLLFSTLNINRIDNKYVKHFLTVGVVFYAMIAVMYAGAIPRYAAPALVFTYPAIGFWWAAAKDDAAIRRKAVRFFGVCYAGFLAAGIA